MSLVLEKSNLSDYLGFWSRKYAVYAPVVRRKVVTFELWRRGDEVVLDYGNTDMPVKHAFFPPRETLLESAGGDASAPFYGKKIMVFGIRPYDVQGLKVMDEAFMKPVKDTYYSRRRKDSVIVAVEHGDVPNSFYGEFEMDMGDGCDLMLTDEGDRYLLDAKTPAGEDLVKNAYVKASNSKSRQPRIPKSGAAKLDLAKISRFLDQGPEHEVWRNLAKECFGCGVCAYVCPICHCFDVEDRLGMDGKTARRDRVWDSCMLCDFTMVAGGFNYRGKRHERIHNWYHHKFSRALKERGRPDCVGCGRCITYCPAKIKIHDVIRKCEELG